MIFTCLLNAWISKTNTVLKNKNQTHASLSEWAFTKISSWDNIKIKQKIQLFSDFQFCYTTKQNVQVVKKLLKIPSPLMLNSITSQNVWYFIYNNKWKAV